MKANTTPTRRRWNALKPRHWWDHQAEHLYVCRHCDIIRESVLLPAISPTFGATDSTSTYWTHRWTTASMVVTVSQKTPPCPGPPTT